MRLEEKKAALDKLINPPQILPVKSEKKSKPSKKTPPPAVARTKKGEPEVEPEPLPYLPSPDELILIREGTDQKIISAHSTVEKDNLSTPREGSRKNNQIV